MRVELYYSTTAECDKTKRTYLLAVRPADSCHFFLDCAVLADTELDSLQALCLKP